MKKLLPFILLTSLLLSACSIDWTDSKEKKIAELEKQIQEDIFKKKQECEKYKNVIENKIEKRIKEALDWSAYFVYDESLEEVIYSKNEETCFALIDLNYIFNKPSWGPADERNEYKVITDLLTGEDASYDRESLPSYYEKVKKLKWE